ncbi:MAG TPA: DUF4388 domain-containing protein, partial [Kofleriaceae bacterium]|nr:DUF4388 domain-containing protein [Kofleriaceae bacterium]
VIFLTALGSDEDRIRGFRLGADDYLAKPFRFEELDLRVAKTLRHRQSVEQTVQRLATSDGVPTKRASEGSSGLGGDLGQLGLSSLLTLLDMERKSGILVLRDAESQQTGRIFLRAGRVIAARIDGRTSPINEECVYHLLRWKSGSFEFDQSEVDMKDEIGTTTTHLLMEGARRLDETSAAG